ncbi:MAG: group 1 truncated hemoglobin [Sphingomonas bacterium]|nr:group 1 truncated hemoglobin [Sphingomonas bacterium]
MIAFILAAALAAQTIVIREEPVAPYVQADANAGASPFKGDGMWRAFHGSDGVARIVDGTVDRLLVDKRVADIFKSHDIERLRRTLNEQLCYILNGGCSYTGRTMQSSHKDMGIQTADLGALVEDMQAAMRDEHVEFAAQNRLLAKLAAMKRDVVGQ